MPDEDDPKFSIHTKSQRLKDQIRAWGNRASMEWTILYNKPWTESVTLKTNWLSFRNSRWTTHSMFEINEMVA